MKILYMGVFVEKFQSPVLGPNFDLGGGLFRGHILILIFFNPQKSHPCIRPCRLSHRTLKSAEGSDL